MRRLTFWVSGIVAALLALFLLIGPGIVEGSMNKVVPTGLTVTPEAVALHKSLTIADMHSDTLMWQRNLLNRSGRGHVDLPRLNDGNVALQVFSSVTKTPKGQNYDSNSAQGDNITLLAMAQLQPIRTWHSLLQRSLWHAEKLKRAEAASNGKLVIVRSSPDLQAWLGARAMGKSSFRAMLSIEGLQNLEGKIENLDKLYDAGFRMAGFTHFFDNELAGSMHGERKGGLTSLGREVLRRMEAKGMVVDIAHCSHTCVAEILTLATKPVVSSHGGVQATCKVNRNLTDDEIKGVAKSGGVIGIGYWDGAICSTEPAAFARAVKHVRDLVGIDHVGLGSDFDGATTTPFDTSGLAIVTQALIDAGFNQEEIGKVMGGNVLRLLVQTLPQK